jgi:hypothetical protein
VDDTLAWIVARTGSRAARRGERIQSLWSGYGELFRVHLDGGPRPSAVVKWARPPVKGGGDRSDLRKRRSFEVETTWYCELASRCGDGCRVPALLGARSGDGEWVLLLEDLDAAGFPDRRRRLEGAALDACLRWLAAFHARFLGQPPTGLWATGTYWHLATRPDELAAIDDDELRAAAPILDRALEGCPFRTLVHGDAKEANFCFSPDGEAVAAVDFQYVGGGCGMKDLAYLLHGRSDEPEDGVPTRHLDTYFAHLRAALKDRDPAIDAGAVEASWRALYPVAAADFHRFLAGWAGEHWRRDPRGRSMVRRAVRGLR